MPRLPPPTLLTPQHPVGSATPRSHQGNQVNWRVPAEWPDEPRQCLRRAASDIDDLVPPGCEVPGRGYVRESW